MNPTRLPKEVLLAEWARRDMRGTKDDRLQWLIVSAITAIIKQLL
jgi:hypothetical protein